ncbi:hypothetical protein FE844_003405 [Rhizobium indicum]|uniref:hypothetical protein n=1 Tax=Rhizobium indicum TaxID=2583231 RepID=UPI001570E65D|nr:hypothetical protein [Rhizobium indicum]QKK28678.1 hypothetical protein FE844_003405 [Rhizobium indicum]
MASRTGGHCRFFESKTAVEAGEMKKLEVQSRHLLTPVDAPAKYAAWPASSGEVDERWDFASW